MLNNDVEFLVSCVVEMNNYIHHSVNVEVQTQWGWVGRYGSYNFKKNKESVVFRDRKSKHNNRHNTGDEDGWITQLISKVSNGYSNQ